MKHLARFVLLGAVLTAFSCGVGSNKATDVLEITDYGEQDQAPGMPGAADGNTEEELDLQQGPQIERKLIKTADLRYEAADLATEKAKWLRAVQRWKGYVGTERDNKYPGEISTTLTLRVPAANFDSLLAQGTHGISVFDRKQIDVSDVTDEFVDISARLKTKKELEARYRELLKMAKTVSEVLEIERELGTLRADIESIEGRLTLLSSQVSLSTIEVTFYEAVSTGNPFGSRVAKAFVSGWDNLLSFITGLLHIWPFILVAGGLAFTIVKISRRKSKGQIK